MNLSYNNILYKKYTHTYIYIHTHTHTHIPCIYTYIQAHNMYTRVYITENEVTENNIYINATCNYFISVIFFNFLSDILQCYLSLWNIFI